MAIEMTLVFFPCFSFLFFLLAGESAQVDD